MLKVKTIKRRSYSKLHSAAELPNLLDVQRDSYENFLQLTVKPEKRENKGLQAVFQDIFPISDVHENYTLEFVKYMLGRPRYTIRESRERNMSYAAPLKATLRLVVRDPEDKTKVKDIIEQDVFLGELPLLTPTGTFIINGAERVIVTQLHRSPGVFFDEEIHPNGKRLYSARIIPYRGSWVEFNLDVNDCMFVHIDTRRKLPATTLLRALDYSTDKEIISLFYPVEKIEITGRSKSKALGKTCAQSVVDPKTEETVIKSGEILTEDHWENLKKLKISSIEIITKDLQRDHRIILNTLQKDATSSREEALFKIYTLLRPGEPPSIEMAQGLLERLFFTAKRYDLGEVGRYKINQRLNLTLPITQITLSKKDFTAIILYLLGYSFFDLLNSVFKKIQLCPLIHRPSITIYIFYIWVPNVRILLISGYYYIRKRVLLNLPLCYKLIKSLVKSQCILKQD